ncbi:hypothetical protein BEL04_06440 [Mucilaginibacter sp. PPCGB 2223]|uniref:universal stress protein n=1 Tax=Mucilaginibacter sp. PPCGB 2223 TaxID=1886027 RepID=UPI000826EBBE|nr:universal stress protein [Mucilaginibacter sp. PPCGB 2223]OCX53915.1 hypothetical protein BEL04_06440 [Mucilaginibacter sp. PPCGB 2223]
MKTLLLSTDFSSTADHAVKYGYHLAQNIHANVVLCHAFIVPAEVPQAGMVVWPMDAYDEILHDNDEKLKRLKASLGRQHNETGFTPDIRIFNQTGPVGDVVRNAANSEKADMIVIGTHHSGLNTLLVGDHDKALIDHLGKPLLLVPPNIKLKSPQKIAFASDFKHPDQDMQLILGLMPLIRTLGAELYITHVQPMAQHSEHQLWLSRFLTDIAKQATYPRVFSRVIDDDDRVAALERLCTSGEMDLLVMVHHRRSFFEELFRGSYTKKTAKSTKVPLLVLHPTE